MKTTEQINWKQGTDAARFSYMDDVRDRLRSTMKKIEGMSARRWHFYRKLLNESDFPARKEGEEVANRAFYKLWEMLSVFPELLPNTQPPEGQVRTLHLAEAPGSFVQALSKKLQNDDRNTGWTCLAVSRPLSTYAEVVKSSKQIPRFHCKITAPHLYADLETERGILEVQRTYAAMSGGGGAHFVTADGGIDDEGRYEDKEALHYRLILGEIICILLNQAEGGCCCLKIFETFTETSLTILQVLVSHYEEFRIIKPRTSRPTNAEKYIVCKSFKGLDLPGHQLLSLLRKEEITTRDALNVEVEDGLKNALLRSTRDCAHRQIASMERIFRFVTLHLNHSIDKRPFETRKKDAFDAWKVDFRFPT